MKRVMTYMLILPLCIAAMVSCTGTKTDARELQGRWTITEVEGDKVMTERTAFMEFNMADMRLHGNAGCNTFNANIKLDSDDASKMKIDQAVTTMMACPDMETENKIMKAIDSVSKVKKDTKTNEILLTDNVGKVIFHLTKE